MVWHAQLRGIIQDELYSAVCAIGLQNTELVAWQSVVLDMHLSSVQGCISSLAAELRATKPDLIDTSASSATTGGSSTPSTARCDGSTIQSSSYTFPVSATNRPTTEGSGLGTSTRSDASLSAMDFDIIAGNDVDALRLHGLYVDCLAAGEAVIDHGDDDVPTAGVDSADLLGNDVDALRLHGLYFDCPLAGGAGSVADDAYSVSEPTRGSFRDRSRSDRVCSCGQQATCDSASSVCWSSDGGDSVCSLIGASRL